ncbi:uncharacterized protein LOC108475244 [Gossypium arboreum]|uniref:uncharacterized protein LOC108475244 n=1 Tax=Gossypium arboreum TaxID=29729 RepID=UPI00081910C7|nr:uncharacterized protein LOC108475244 [Gossypium arboreum]
MCKRFEEGLNEEIKLLIRILEIREFAALAGRAKKAEGLNNERKQAKREARVTSKRTSSKVHSFPTKKSMSRQDRSTSSVGYSGSARSSKRHNPKSSSPLATSVGSIDDQRLKCMSCNKFHFGECRMKSGACYRCGSLNHFFRDCPKRSNREVEPALRSIAPNSRGKPLRPHGSASDSRTVARNSTAKLEARAPAITYAICTRG